MTLTFEYVLVPQRSRPVPRPASPPKPRRVRYAPDRLARALALGLRIRDMWEAGQITDLKEAAIRLHLSPPRITQFVGLTFLAADLQERVLLGTLTIAETHLRKALVSADWNEQRAILKDMP
jgi:hypothetical protein